jgi:tetratricopeptide (TPR) repeat protein
MGGRSCWLLLLLFAGCVISTGPESSPAEKKGSKGKAERKKAEAKRGPVPVTTKDPAARELFEAGRIKADRFRQAEAAKDFRSAVDKDPDFALAWLQLAYVSGSAREFEEALARAVAAKSEVSEVERLMIDAAVSERGGRVDESQKLWAEVVRRYPDDPRAHYQLGLAYWLDRDDAAVGQMEKAVELYPGLDAAWNMLGYVYSALDRHDEAVRAHRRYVELLPDEPNAHDSLAEILMKAGNFEESISEYERALALDPSFIWSRMGIGHNQIFLEEYGEAHKTYETALYDAKGLYQSYQAADWLVVLGVYADDAEAALDATDKAVEIATKRGQVERAWALRGRARVLLFGGKAEEAEAVAKAALAGLPDNASDTARSDLEQAVLRLEVEARVARKDMAGARKLLEELRGKAGASESAWQQQLFKFAEGFVSLAEGKAEEADAAFSASSTMDPRVIFFLAEAKRAQKKRAEANRLYRQVVDWYSPSMSHALVLEKAKARLYE